MDEHYFEPLLATNEARTALLVEQGAIPRETGEFLLRALLDLEADGSEALDGAIDAAVQRYVAARVGADAARTLALGSSEPLTRLALRELLLDAAEEACVHGRAEDCARLLAAYDATNRCALGSVGTLLGFDDGGDSDYVGAIATAVAPLAHGDDVFRALADATRALRRAPTREREDAELRTEIELRLASLKRARRELRRTVNRLVDHQEVLSCSTGS